MGKKRSKRSRFYHPKSNRRLRFASLINYVPYSPLKTYEDRRSWHPDLLPSARSFNSSLYRLTVTPRQPQQAAAPRNLRSFYSTPYKISFAQPQNVLVCVRRKQRKEILFAKNKAGRSGQKKPRRSYYSSIKC